MKILKVFFLLGIISLNKENVLASEKKQNDLENNIILSNLWVRPTYKISQPTALYLTITNASQDTNFLTEVKTPIAQQSTISKTIIENTFVTNINIAKVAIPGKSTVFFAPKGIHIKLSGLQHNLKIGDKIKFQFYFEKNIIVEKYAIVTN